MVQAGRGWATRGLSSRSSRECGWQGARGGCRRDGTGWHKVAVQLTAVASESRLSEKMSVSLPFLQARPLLRRQKLPSPGLAALGPRVRVGGGVPPPPKDKALEARGECSAHPRRGHGGCPSAPGSGQATIYVPAQGASVSFFSQALFSTPDRGHPDRKGTGPAGGRPDEAQRAGPLGDPGAWHPPSGSFSFAFLPNSLSCKAIVTGRGQGEPIMRSPIL